MYCNVWPQEPNFVGRENDKDKLLKKLSSRSYIINLWGIPGVGKTALAIKIADFLKEKQIFDCLVWIDAKGKGLILEDILDIIARDVFKNTDIVAKVFAEKNAETRKLLQDFKCLLIVDSFDDVADERIPNFIHDLPEPSKALLTSREKPELPCDHIHLYGLDEESALILIRSEAESRELEKVINARDEQILPIYKSSDGLPLAMKIAVGLLSEGLSFTEVENILIGALQEGNAENFWRKIFGESWSKITEEAKIILMIASIFPSSLSWESLKIISDVQGHKFRTGLLQLIRMALLEPSSDPFSQSGYSVEHPLIRAFAQNKLHNEYNLESEAIKRSINYYIGLLKNSSSDLKEGYTKINYEVRNILFLLKFCHQIKDFKTVLDFLEVFSYFLYDMGYWRERQEWSRKGYDAAISLAEKDENEHHRAAKCAYWTGWFYFRGGEYNQAREWAHKADVCFRKIHFHEQEPRVTQLLGMIEFGLENYPAAEKLFNKALTGFQEEIKKAETDEEKENKLFWLVTVKTNLGDLTKVKGDSLQSKKLYQKAEELYNEVFQDVRKICFDEITNDLKKYDRWAARLARTSGNLGDVCRRIGNIHSAIQYYEMGYKIAKECRLLNTVGACAIGLGLLIWDDNKKRSVSLLKEGLDIFKQLGSRAMGEKLAMQKAEKLLEFES